MFHPFLIEMSMELNPVWLKLVINSYFLNSSHNLDWFEFQSDSTIAQSDLLLHSYTARNIYFYNIQYKESKCILMIIYFDF